MATKLVIVESPAKAKTLGKYLGSGYTIRASNGHIRDLPAKKLAVDIENDFQPEYEVIQGKSKVVQELRKAASRATEVFLATDPDREGEAIAWHITTLLNKQPEQLKRVLFHEITKNAVREAVKHPGSINMNRVDAQQARRVLDRLVGYKVSEQLWSVIARGLSAGRVQSVALRLIVEREQEIDAFQPEEYWLIKAEAVLPDKNRFDVKLVKIKGKEAKIPDGETAGKVLHDLKTCDASLYKIQSRITVQKPVPPFITSTLQQEAARRLRYPVKRTMVVAQQLYEGQELGDAGSVGLITYMRTDSTRISKTAIDGAREFISREFGKEYLSPKPRVFRSKKSAQDAHEAIRPTSFDWPPERVKPFLKPQHYRLYKLIWDRFMATQMADAKYLSVTVDVGVNKETPDGATGKKSVPDYLLRASGRRLLFAGFRRLWGELPSEENGQTNENGRELPEIFFNSAKKDGKGKPVDELTGQPVKLEKVEGNQKFTQPPPRFSESALVKILDELGIGRPSTYAQIISTLLDRKYVDNLERKLVPTELGKTVNQVLTSEFDEVFNTKFTARMEEALDKVEEGTPWVETVRTFWEPFSSHIERFKSRKDEIRKSTQKELGRKCPECGEGELIERMGRYGKFIACSNYPKCKYVEKTVDEKKSVPSPEKTGRTCPECKEGELLIRKGRYGKFIACSNYPKCKYTERIEGEGGNKKGLPDVQLPCPRKSCGGTITAKRNRRGQIFYSCTNWKKKGCKVVFNDEPVASECPECHYPIRLKKGSNLVCPECKHKEVILEQKANA